MPRAARLRLYLVVFAAGAASLATEMSGARLLAPFFGASDLVWANLIGLILLYLSLGYWLGGRLADRYPTHRALGCTLLVAAVSVAILPFAARPLLGSAADAFATVSAGAYIGSFAGTLLLFAVPVTALGMVAPWAIRLSVVEIAEAGAVSGRLYALSTIGSIFGTFGASLLLIPWIGVRRTLLTCALLLAVTAASLLPRIALAAPVALIALIALPPGQVRGAAGERVLYEGESAYQFVQVVERTDGTRILHLNEGWAMHSVLPPSGVLTNGYWDAFLTLPLLDGRPAGRLAVLGNAAGTIPWQYQRVWPQQRIDGVELDPLVSSVGRRFFAMSNPRLQVHTADARWWLRGARGPFDAIVVDAYRQPYLPFHLATEEFFQLAHDRLGPNGVVAVNVGTPPDQQQIVQRIAATMRRVFPAVVSARYDAFNSILIAFRDPRAAAQAPSLLGAARGWAAVPAALLAGRLRTVPPGGAILTDDLAPVEWLTDRALISYIREGAPNAR